jgi:PAS domain-containing protein
MPGDSSNAESRQKKAESWASHLEEVGAYLARSNDVAQRAECHVDQVNAYLARSNDVAQRAECRVVRVNAYLVRSNEAAQRAAWRVDRLNAYLTESLRLLRAARHVEETPDVSAFAPEGVRNHVSVAERFGRQVEAIRASGTDWDLQQALLVTTKALQEASDELRRGRRLVEREHAKFLDVSEATSMPTLITDGKAAVRDANRAAAAMLGVEQNRLPGRLLIGFVARNDVDRFRMFAAALWNGPGNAAHSVVVRIRPRGHPVVRAKLAARVVRSVKEKNVCLRWTIERAQDVA